MSELFSQDTINFLIENKMRNDKGWFEEHKNQYNEYVTTPLISLVKSLEPTLMEIDSKLICSPKLGGSVSRIWRDVRFSKDKSIFRDFMWCMFVRKKNEGLPEFFFVVTPEDFFYGCGYYSAGAASMNSMRKLIISGDKDFKTALAAYKTQDLFKIEGDLYKRSRHPDMPENLKDWLDRKTICFMRRSNDLNLLCSDKLSSTIAEGYKAIAPIYHFLLKAEDHTKQ